MYDSLTLRFSSYTCALASAQMHTANNPSHSHTHTSSHTLLEIAPQTQTHSAVFLLYCYIMFQNLSCASFRILLRMLHIQLFELNLDYSNSKCNFCLRKQYYFGFFDNTYGIFSEKLDFSLRTGTRTRDARSATALHVSAMPTRLSAPTVKELLINVIIMPMCPREIYMQIILNRN